MKTTLLVFVLWVLLVVLTSCVRADYYDVYSLYLEHSNYLHEVDSGRLEYNPEIDKGFGIDIQNACDEVGRSDLKYCFLNMLFQLGLEYRVYKGF